MRVMVPAVLCFLFLLVTTTPPDVNTLTSLSTSQRRTVTDPRRQVQNGNCGQGHCTCEDDHADCDGNLFAVKSVPALPSNTVSLHMEFFDLQNLSMETAKNLVSLPLQELRLEASNILSMDPAVLATFTNLSVLSLLCNAFSEAALHRTLQGLSNRKLQLLDLSYMILESLFPLTSMQSTTVVALDLRFTTVSVLNMSVLQNLKGLSVLNVGYAKVRDVYFTFLPELKVLNLERNSFDDFLDFCPNGAAVLPKLERLILSGNGISSIDPRKIQCLASLRVLDISQNKLNFFRPNTFSSLRRLEMVHMQNMKGGSFFMKGYSFNNSNLFYLDISNVHLSMAISDSSNYFAGCRNLSTLSISGNDLSIFPDQLLSSLLSHLPALQHLSTAKCQLKQIPDFLVHLPKLTDINLSGNLFTTPAKPLSLKLQDTLQIVRIGNNPFHCSCSWLWLKEWIARNTTTFPDYPDSYVCVNPPYDGVLLEDFPMSEQSCLLGPTTTYLVVALSSVLLFLMSILPVIYRYRWNIQYLAFMLRYDRNRHNRNAQQEARHFRYDAFVIYDSKDHAWVVNHLMAALEHTQGLGLCLHERDFLAGRLIVDNIVDNISASRKVIAIMSEGSATSEWCQFELSLTHRLTLERGHDLLVVVMLEEVARAHVTRTMYAVLKTTTYIAWPDDERAREAFWNRLGEAVRL